MRVFITGLGAVSALGTGARETMDRLLRGERGVRERRLFDLPGAKSTLAAEVPDLDPSRIFGRANGDDSRTDAMAVLAAREALAEAKLSPKETVVDLILGGTTAGMFETEELLTRLDGPLDAAMGERLRTHPLSSTVDKLVSVVGPFGVARTVCCACTSGAAAIALGLAWLRTGRSRIVLAGGADALCRLTYSGFGALSVLDPSPCRPFDRTRAGLTLGEGAGMVVLETEASARARDARPIAEIVGVAMASEAHHITNPEPGGATAARIMSQAIASAGLTPRDVGYVNAHGTGTPQNDSNEAAAIRACFGDARVPVSSSKGQLGHTLGASGALEAVVSALALERRALPPTAGLVEPDPACDLDHVLDARAVDLLDVVASSSFGFGGTGATLVLARPGRAQAARAVTTTQVVVTGLAVVAPRGMVTGLEAARLVALEGVGDDAPAGGDPTASLDPAKARRMDRAGRLSAAVLGAALADADARGATKVDRRETAALSGTAFGSVDGSMRFMKRVLDKGAGLASPADFPNLVPSSPVSHASIYLGLGGPAIATPDLNATAESAIATGVELIEAGVSPSAIAGSVEEVSQLTERVLAPLLGMRPMAAHSEGASAVVLEAAPVAEARGARALARVAFAKARRTTTPWADLPDPGARAIVVSEPAVEVEGLLAGSSWRRVRHVTTSAAAGDHVGCGGIAFAGAVALVARGHVDKALVLGHAPDRTYAFVLERVEDRA